MPINPNIALGAQPQQQPNMLGQLGQMMAIKAAQQEMEGNEDVRNALSRGAPEDPTQLLQYGKQGRATYESLLKGKKEQLESAEKRLTMTGQIAGYVRDNPTPENFITAVSTMKQNGLLTQAQADRIIADAGDDPIKIKSYADRAASDALKEADRLTARTRIQAANIGAGPGYLQAGIARERLTAEQRDRAELDALYGRTPSAAPATAPMAGGGGGGSSIMVNPAQPNALIQGAAPALSPNMLRPDAQAPAGAAPAPAPVAATPGDVFKQIEAIDAELARLKPYMSNPKAAPMLQQLIAQRTQLLASAKNQYGGQETTMEVTDPDTGQRTVVKARPNQYGVLVPVEMAPVPLSTDASATGGTGISPTVARPAPSAATVKERQATERLPEAIAMNTDAIRKIDEMIGGVDAKGNPLAGAAGQAHPGLSKATGFGGGVMRFFSGTDGKNFEIRHKEVLGQAFLDAFEALKGGGAITEKEGEKATAARTRMDLAQSKEEYMEAAREYQGVLKRGVENARARMQRSGTAPAAGAQADPLGIR